MDQGACKFPAVTNMSQKQRPLTTEMLSEGSTETLWTIFAAFLGIEKYFKIKSSYLKTFRTAMSPQV